MLPRTRGDSLANGNTQSSPLEAQPKELSGKAFHLKLWFSSLAGHPDT